MSGIAIIIPGISFGTSGLGKVTPTEQEEVPLVSLAIIGEDSVTTGNKAQYLVEYTPANTTQKGVQWTITSGGMYAKIDESGMLTVLESATTPQGVTIRATSTQRPSIYVEKMVSVLYEEKVVDIPVTAIEITGSDTIEAGANSLQLAIKYTPENTTETTVLWETSDGNVATVDSSGMVTVNLPHRYFERQVTIKATSVSNDAVTTQKTITIKEKAATDYVKDGLVADYDAVDNLDTGTHDNSATKWVDKAGTYDMNIRMSQYKMYWRDKAYELTGCGDVTDVGFTREGYPLQNVGSGDFTVEITFTTNDGMYDAHLGFFLYAYVTGRFQFSIDYKTSDGTGHFKASLYSDGWKDHFYLDEHGEKVPVSDNGEFHVAAFVRSGSTWKLYDNGVLRGTFTLAGFNLLSESITMLLAQDGQPFAYHSYKFYNKALTDTEAAQNHSFEKNYYK